jgi:UTP:GlnB (protein PII) uridylyltransferase
MASSGGRNHAGSKWRLLQNQLPSKKLSYIQGRLQALLDETSTVSMELDNLLVLQDRLQQLSIRLEQLLEVKSQGMRGVKQVTYKPYSSTHRQYIEERERSFVVAALGSIGSVFSSSIASLHGETIDSDSKDSFYVDELEARAETALLETESACECPRRVSHQLYRSWGMLCLELLEILG